MVRKRRTLINGLPIMVKQPSCATMDIDNLDLYYEDCVIGVPGSFAVSIKDPRQLQGSDPDQAHT
jgi:hypothetical protein